MRTVVNTPGGATATEFAEVAEPQPADDEALVAVRAFSVNRGELALLKGRSKGWRPGQDVAGVVVTQAESGAGPTAGDRVVGLVDGAGWSQFVGISTKRVAVLPGEVSMEEAASLPVAGLTALRTLRIAGNLLGRRVMVTGANGAVGRFQVELAALCGAEVTAVTTKADKVGKELHLLGAADVITDIEEASGLFDVVEESVGGASLGGAIKKIAPGGTVVVLGTSSGEPTPLDVYSFIGHEGARLQSYLSYASTDPDDRDLQILVDLVAADRLHPTVGYVADWSELNAAIELLGERRLERGKAILTITD